MRAGGHLAHDGRPAPQVAWRTPHQRFPTPVGPNEDHAQKAGLMRTVLMPCDARDLFQAACCAVLHLDVLYCTCVLEQHSDDCISRSIATMYL